LESAPLLNAALQSEEAGLDPKMELFRVESDFVPRGISLTRDKTSSRRDREREDFALKLLFRERGTRRGKTQEPAQAILA